MNIAESKCNILPKPRHDSVLSCSKQRVEKYPEKGVPALSPRNRVHFSSFQGQIAPKNDEVPSPKAKEALFRKILHFDARTFTLPLFRRCG